MSDSLFRRVVVPIASKDDARATTRALVSQNSVPETVVAVHVIEKAGGAPDKASVEQRERDTEAMFDIVRTQLSGYDVDLETEILYGTDVAETIVEAGHDLDASAIVFTPRGGSRWIRLLAGDVALSLISESDLPVVVLPDEPEVEDE